MQHFLGALGGFSLYLVVSAGFCAAFLYAYTLITPHDEIELISREHNVAAAISVGMSLLGFVIPLCRALSQSTDMIEYLLWGVVAFLVQLAAYGLARFAHRGLPDDIRDGRIAGGLWCGFISLAAGLLSAAAMTG